MSNLVNNAKRGRNDLDSSGPSQAENIIMLLEGLSTKMDNLNETVSVNSKAIKEKDARLSTKIDNLESVVAENINRVKTDIDNKIISFTTDINNRFENLASATHTSCQSISKENEDILCKFDNVQQDNESRFSKLEREQLRNELVLTGIPAVYGENVFNIVGDICDVLNCQIGGHDISAAYRLPSSTVNSAKNRRGRHSEYSPPIILKLNNDWAKQELVSAYFQKKNLNIADIGYQSKARIYINESLTKHNRQIFKAATEAKKFKQIVKCYTRNGIVHVQQSEQGKIHRINCTDQLNALMSTASIQTNTSATSHPSAVHPPDQPLSRNSTTTTSTLPTGVLNTPNDVMPNKSTQSRSTTTSNPSTTHPPDQPSFQTNKLTSLQTNESTATKSTFPTEVLHTVPSTTPGSKSSLHDEERMEG